MWLSYLFVLFYLAAAAGAVTHRDLFFEHTVKLPFLTGVELPLVAFFALAPLIFVVVHAYTLVHLVMLTDKARRYHAALYEKMRDKKGPSDDERIKKRNEKRKEQRDKLRLQLPSNIFIQFLAGPSGLREGSFGWLLRAIAWITLVIAPVLLMLMMQIQFLSYHSSFVAWTQRVALAADLVLIWWLWRRILSGREAGGGHRRLTAWFWPLLGLTLSLGALLFSAAIVTFPGEWQEERLPSWAILPALDELGQPGRESLHDLATEARRLSVHDWLFVEKPDPVTRRRFPFSSTLVLPGLNVYEGLGIDDPEKLKERDFVFRARGRDLKGAIFDLAMLPKVDFEGSNFEGASLQGAQLRGASLRGAQLQGASLSRAELQGASLDSAQLQGASLGCVRPQAHQPSCADLQGASLNGAQLQSASLSGADLEGASLNEAQLQSASLDKAQLQGASLKEAQLQGAFLWGAQLQGASLSRANLEGARLDSAQLQGASLFLAHLQGASLDKAQLQGASLADAQLQGATLQAAALNATDLSRAYLWRTNIRAGTPPMRSGSTGRSGIRRGQRMILGKGMGLGTTRPIRTYSRRSRPWRRALKRLNISAG